MTLIASLRSPRRHIARLDDVAPTFTTAPHRTWAALTAIAFGGSALYGASLALVLPNWKPVQSGIWLTASAGAGWCVFGPLLVLATRHNPFSCAHACLVAMAYGEGVLVSGAGVNAALRVSGRMSSLHAGRLNVGIVCLSNVVMAGALAGQLRTLGVPARKTLLLWNVGLNGSGAVAFLFLRHRLQRES